MLLAALIVREISALLNNKGVTNPNIKTGSAPRNKRLSALLTGHLMGAI